jgi:hypothetical protein
MRKIAVTALVALAACQSPEPIDLPCESDNHCAPGFHCDLASGKCIGGEQGPTVEIQNPAAGTPVRGTIEIEVSAADPDGVKSIDVTVGGKTAGQVSGTADNKTLGGKVSFDTTQLDDGDATIVAIATDANETNTGSHAELVIKVDNTQPTVQGLSVTPQFAKNDGKVTVAFTTSEPIDAPVVTVGSASATHLEGSAYTFIYTAKQSDGAGVKAVNVTLTDEAGNAGEASGQVTFDFTAPTFTNVVSTPDPAKAGPIGITFTASEDLFANPTVKVGATRTATFGTKTAAGGAFNYTYSYTASAANDSEAAPTAITVTGEDKARNPGSGAGTVKFDFTPPEVLDVTATPNAAGAGQTVTFEISVSEPLQALPVVGLVGSSGFLPVQLTVTNAGSGAYTATYTATGSENASAVYTLIVDVVDPAGNSSQRQVANILSFDFTPPALDGAKMDYWRKRTETDEVVLRPGATEAGATVKVFLDSGGLALLGSGTASATVQVHISIPSANHAITVYAKAFDAAGNASGFVEPAHRVIYMSPAGTNNTLVAARFATQGASIPVPAKNTGTPSDLSWFGGTANAPLAPLAAQDGTWGAYTTSGTGPASWISMSMLGECNNNCSAAYDKTRNRFVLVAYPPLSGGAETWELDPSAITPAWVRKDSGNGPGVRPLAFDTVRGLVLAFDGRNAGQGTSQIWEWNGTSWTSVPLLGSVNPGERIDSIVAWDDNVKRLVVGLGYYYPSGGGQAIESSDTFAYDPATQTFTQVTGALFPPTRYSAAAAYHPGRQGVVVVGGSTNNSPFVRTDAWLLKNVSGSWSWSFIGDLGANFSAYNPTLGYVSSKATMVLIDAGGQVYSLGNSGAFNSGYGGVSPLPPYTQGASLVDTNAGPVLFGGGYGAALPSGPVPMTYNTMWRYASGGWALLNSQSQPSALRAHRMAYDAARQELVSFGGRNDTKTDDQATTISDVWRYKAGQWSLFIPPTGGYIPPPVAYSGLVPLLGKLFFYGGLNYSSPVDSAGNFTGAAFESINPPPPSFVGPRSGHAMVQYGTKVLGFGGSYAGTALNDTFEFDGASWFARNPVLPSGRPTARDRAAMVNANGRVFLFGGRTNPSPGAAVLDDVWEYTSTATWTQRTKPAGSPPWPTARYDHSMYWDPLRSRVVVFGGTDQNGVRQGDLWEYDPSNFSWQPVTTSTTATDANNFPPTHPGIRAEHAMAFDPASGRGLLMGGFGGSRGASGDSWQIAYETHGRLVVFFNFFENALFDVIPEYVKVRAVVSRGGTVPTGQPPGIGMYMPRDGRTWELVGQTNTASSSEIVLYSQYDGSGDFFPYFSEGATVHTVFAPLTAAPGVTDALKVDFVEFELGYAPCPVPGACTH